MDGKDREKDKKVFKDKIASQLKAAMEEMKMDQSSLAKEAENRGYKLTQSTISKVLSGENFALYNVVCMAKVLNLDLNELFMNYSASIKSGREQSGKEKVVLEEEKGTLICDPNDKKIQPYLHKYYAYFRSTISDEETIFCGILDISASPDQSRCIAKFSFHTGKNLKEYTGEIALSPKMKVVYCRLVNREFGEISYVVFSDIDPVKEDIHCMVAMVLTSSAGAGPTRLPTAHKMILCTRELSEEEREILKGQLYLGRSEILISEDRFEEFLRDDRLDPAMKKEIEKETRGGIPLRGTEARYFRIDERPLRKIKHVTRKDKACAISLIRQYSEAPKYTKVGEKCNRFVHDFIDIKKEKND